MRETRWSLSIPKMQLLQIKKEKLQNTIILEIENISLRQFVLKYPTINKEETALNLIEIPFVLNKFLKFIMSIVR